MLNWQRIHERLMAEMSYLSPSSLFYRILNRINTFVVHRYYDEENQPPTSTVGKSL